MAYHFFIMSFMYIALGIMHFIKPKPYTVMMPKYIPAHKAMIFWSGMAEVALGIALLFEQTRVLAIWGIILMLTIFLTVHIDMLTNTKIKGKVPRWFIWLRLPMQFGLMYWAYFYL